MANVENIVKIMNFHSLLRVDKSKRKAEKYFLVEDELTKMIMEIFHNKNLTLDKKIGKENKHGKDITVYVGNDLGFCSNFNSSILKLAKEDQTSNKIIIGKKIFLNDKNVMLNITKEEFYQNFSKIEALVKPFVENKELHEINVVYNHYYSVNDIRLERKKIFPVEFDESQNIDLDVDYVIETNVNSVLTELIILYLCYQLKIIEINSWASENIMREKTTRESLKKIEEIEEEKVKNTRKIKKAESFRKQISNYRNVGGK